jgi:hypothetical protein
LTVINRNAEFHPEITNGGVTSSIPNSSMMTCLARQKTFRNSVIMRLIRFCQFPYQLCKLE